MTQFFFLLTDFSFLLKTMASPSKQMHVQTTEKLSPLHHTSDYTDSCLLFLSPFPQRSPADKNIGSKIARINPPHTYKKRKSNINKSLCVSFTIFLKQLKPFKGKIKKK